MCLFPLHTYIAFKPTNTGCYIPWSSDTPRHTKVGWFIGELVRALRICSHKVYFNICTAFFIRRLKRLDYPTVAFSPLPRQWGDRRCYLG